MRKTLPLRLAGLALALTIFSSCSAKEQPLGASDSSEPQQIIKVDGYPLDRSLTGLVMWNQLDAAVVLDDIKIGEPRWTTLDGRPPSYIREARAPTEEEGARAEGIVTPVTATVHEALWGNVADGDTITFLIGGGAVGDVSMEASTEVAPSLADLGSSDRLIVAGRVVDSTAQPTLDVAFAYSLSEQGKTVGLMLSAGGDEGRFTLDDLKTMLRLRACSGTDGFRMPARALVEDRQAVGFAC